jgi:vancomycin permeability regulator SanA
MGRARTVAKRIAVAAGAAVLTFAIACNVAVLRGGRARPEPLREADAIIVLGAGVSGDDVSQVLGDRLDTALALYRDGRAKKILLTGDHASQWYDEVSAMRKYLEARGVPSDALLLDGAGVDTFSSIARARMVYGIDRAIVVTQAFHLPRAVWLARSLGIEADGAEADKRVYRGAAWFQVREVISRTKAWVDVGVGRTPRELTRVS